MLFQEYIFIFLLPVIVFLYRALPIRLANFFLTAAGLSFYAFCGKADILSVCAVSVMTWLFGIFIEKPKSLSAKKALLVAFLLIFAGLFVYVKTMTELRIVGFSYYILTASGYLIEIAGGKRAVYNPLKAISVISFFPIMLQGPITDFNELSTGIAKEKKKIDCHILMNAIRRILLGYFKKLIIANRLAPITEMVFNGGDYNGFVVFTGLLIYSVRLIADFTGGIDIAIGIAELLGIRLPENFNKPLLAVSLSDFWSRWHITLSKWFASNVFYPLSIRISAIKGIEKLSKSMRRKIPVYMAALATWSLTGLWHGIGLNFLCWGLANAVILITSFSFKEKYDKFHKNMSFSNGKPYRIFMMVRTFVIVSFLRSFDLHKSPVEAVLSVFRVRGDDFSDFISRVMNISEMNVLILIFTIVAVVCVMIYDNNDKKSENNMSLKYFTISLIKNAAIFIMIVLFGAYGTEFKITDFIYGKF